jgi:hypothetical protein
MLREYSTGPTSGAAPQGVDHLPAVARVYELEVLDVDGRANGRVRDAYGTGMGAAFSPLLTQALVHVPSSEAADASGLLATTIQLSQVAGLAVFGSLFLSQAARQQAHASATAFSTVMLWMAALTLPGVVSATLLARTVRRAT